MNFYKLADGRLAIFDSLGGKEWIQIIRTADKGSKLVKYRVMEVAPDVKGATEVFPDASDPVWHAPNAKAHAQTAGALFFSSEPEPDMATDQAVAVGKTDAVAASTDQDAVAAKGTP